MDPITAIFLLFAFAGTNIATHVVTANEYKLSCEKVKKECKRAIDLKDNDW